MKRFYLYFCLFIILCFPAAASGDSGVLRYALGYSFLSNVKEIKDSYKHLLKDTGVDTDIYNTSLSICFQPYYQFHNGIRAGAGLGPLILLTGDAYHVQVPVNLTLGYSFFSQSRTSAYIRAGLSYHMVSGDYYDSSSPGFLCGIGVEILNTNPIHLGFETAYDASEIKLDKASDQTKNEKIKTGELMFFIYADF